MRNECFFFFLTLSLRSGVIDRIHLSTYSVFRRRNTFAWRCEYRLNGGSKPLYEHMIHKILLSLDKRSQCHTSRQVLMGKFCNQGKADYSDMIVH